MATAASEFTPMHSYSPVAAVVRIVWLLVSSCQLCVASAWVIPWPQKQQHKGFFQAEKPGFRCHPSCLRSTPFEADLYNPFQDDDDDNDGSPLAVPETTRLVIGLNKYSHDTSLCAADAVTGKVLYAQSKERIGRRRKFDAGNVASLVETCLKALHLDLDNIDCVIMNNHHHRILPYLENNVRHMEWEAGLFINGGQEDGYTDPENLLNVPGKMELSHHLAHAYSAATQAPFDHGLICIMDGMGETYRTMQLGKGTDNYFCDYDLVDDDDLPCVPGNLKQLAKDSPWDWREAESIYTFEKQSTPQQHWTIRPVFKRFTPERSPPVLFNHGFENMDSLGALYSRVSSHVFGDWNACGKIMGLAPWANSVWKNEPAHPLPNRVVDKNRPNQRKVIKNDEKRPPLHDVPIVSGSLYRDNGLFINRTLIEGIPLIARNDPELFWGDTPRKRYDFDTPELVPDYSGPGTTTTTTIVTNPTVRELQVPTRVALEAIALAQRMQQDLEIVALDFVQHFQQQTGESNLVLAGGVALNSVLNGRLSRELGFDQTFIPPYPGDDGIAVGCCAFGLFGRPDATRRERSPKPKVWNQPLSPYLGGLATDKEIKRALERAAPWIEVEIVRDDNQRFQRMVDEIASGGVIAWYHGRSEMGPRALGHRSILADPRKRGLVRFINEYVKARESFRPFAPSVLAEYAAEWFDLGNIHNNNNNHNNVSPYMSITAQVKKHQRHKIPAVTHVDGSSRLQTVTQEDEPLYHAFITQFFKATGIPMVLNTSFNTIPGEPIVETPQQAIRSFLYPTGSLEMLVLEDYIITRKKADLRKLLGEVRGQELTMEPSIPQRAGPMSFQATFTVPQGSANAEEVITTTKVQMPNRILHVDGQWFELLDELEAELLSACDGSLTLNDILAHYTVIPEDDDDGNGKVKKKGITTPQQEQEEEMNQLLQNIVHRLSRLFDQTFLYW